MLVISVLADAVVFFHGGDELAALESIVRAGLLDVDVFAGLAGPDGHQRVPVIGSGDGDGVDLLVFEELANIDVGFWLGNAEFFDVADALAEDGFVDVAQGDDLRIGNVREAVDVILAATADAANSDAHTIVRAKDLAAHCQGGRAHRDGFPCGL